MKGIIWIVVCVLMVFALFWLLGCRVTNSSAHYSCQLKAVGTFSSTVTDEWANGNMRPWDTIPKYTQTGGFGKSTPILGYISHPPCIQDSVIKPIVIQYSDSSWFVLEVKGGEIVSRYSTNKPPNFRYTFLEYIINRREVRVLDTGFYRVDYSIFERTSTKK